MRIWVWNVLWEGDHIRLVLTKKDSKGISSELVKQVSASLRKMGTDVS